MNVMKPKSFQVVVKMLNQSKRWSSSCKDPTKTSLYDTHVKYEGKMVDFSGFLLPVQYGKDSITSSHLHTRRKCSLFDVSHMLQTLIHGDDRVELIERITTADARGLPEGKAALTLFTDPQTGGILDDLIVTKTSEGYLYVVSNAGRRDHDINLIRRTEEKMKSEKKSVKVEFLSLNEYSLIALQGPETRKVLQPLVDISLDKLYFLTSCKATIGGVSDCRITRCGYTGEDGVEISIPSQKVSEIVELLLSSKSSEVKLAGLGARDSLRLEAGLCLYGSDIDESTTPVEASLGWLVAKSRRERKDFPGAAVILKQLAEGAQKKRVGLRLEKGPPARHDSEIQDSEGNRIGKVTSGCPSPSLGGSIAMGFVEKKTSKLGTDVQVLVRGRPHPAKITKMPFLTCNYYSQ